jgi:hypothetical protein
VKFQLVELFVQVSGHHGGMKAVVSLGGLTGLLMEVPVRKSFTFRITLFSGANSLCLEHWKNMMRETEGQIGNSGQFNFRRRCMFDFRLLKRALSSVAAVAISLIFLIGQTWAQTASQPSTKKGDWPYYFADANATRYSPQDQINGSNFNQLEVAWHFKTDNLGARPEYKLEGTPLEVHCRIAASGDCAGR